MFYMFVKMTKWHCREIGDISDYRSHIQEHINTGEIVAFADDIEGFADEIGIDENDIVMIN